MLLSTHNKVKNVFLLIFCRQFLKISSYWSWLSSLLDTHGDFLGGNVSFFFFTVTLKAFITIQMTVWTIQNDYLDHVRHVWDIFGTIRLLKLIFQIKFSKTIDWKWVKIRFLPYCDLIKAFTTLVSSETKSFDDDGRVNDD